MINNDGSYPENINSLDTGIDEDTCMSCDKKVEECQCPFDCPKCKEGNLRPQFIWTRGEGRVFAGDFECNMCGEIVNKD